MSRQISLSLLSVLLISLLFLLACSEDNETPTAPEAEDLIGSWIAFKTITSYGSPTYPDSILERTDVDFERKFNSDNSYAHTNGEDGTFPGTWSTSDDTLTIITDFPWMTSTIVFVPYLVDNDTLEMVRHNENSDEWITEYLYRNE